MCRHRQNTYISSETSVGSGNTPRQVRKDESSRVHSSRKEANSTHKVCFFGLVVVVVVVRTTAGGGTRLAACCWPTSTVL